MLPNGFKVYPEDIENALRIAGIRDSVVLETAPGRIEAVVLGSAAGAPGVGAVGNSEPTAVRERLDAAVKAANATLGPEPADRGLAAVAGRGLPAHPHLQDQARSRSGTGSTPTRSPASLDAASAQFGTGYPIPSVSRAAWIPAADGSCDAPGSQS